MVVTIIFNLLVFFALAFAGYSHATPSDQTCLSCHQASHQQWQQSDHAKSLAPPTKTTVLGDFNQQTITHHGQSALFTIKNGQFKVNMAFKGQKEAFTVKYVVGHHPLQQYIVEIEAEPGRLQVLPFSWDSRDKKAGGQRWYFHGGEAPVADNNRLHWRQPLQNYNGMCADCHSDGVKRDYQPDNNQFNTRWDNINVGCLSCHDNKAQAHDKTDTGKPPHNNGAMDSCFACHSLRTPLVDGFDSNTAFLDQFTPELLGGQMYHADGQIKEEVYVYGSFLQSKMYKAGVNCLNCHNKHTMKVKSQNNGLCLQCHSPQQFNKPKHHGHKVADSVGAQCVNCHMPNNRYMGVDDRRDHSFKIPRPDLSEQFGTPNACNQCHTDKTSDWAVKQLKALHGAPKSIAQSKLDLMTLNSGTAIDLNRHWAIVADTKLDGISRASALVLLGRATPMLSAQKLKPYLSDDESLLRLAAVKAAMSVSPVERAALLTPLLSDKYLAIRVAAARGLVGVAVAKTDLTTFNRAFEAMMAAYTVNGWRAEGRIEQGVVYGVVGQADKAEKALIAAITIDPLMEAAYLNLSEFYRMRQQAEQVKQTLLQGLNKLPDSAQIAYAYGLFLVRNGGLALAVEYFKRAMQLAPKEEIYAYTTILALDGSGQGKQALVLLDELLPKYQPGQTLQALKQRLVGRGR